VTLSGDVQGPMRKKVIKHNHKSTDNSCLKCINVYHILTKEF